MTHEPKMDPDLKLRWTKALRSKKFKQGTMNLCFDKHYCCLGVLAELTLTPEEWHDGTIRLFDEDVNLSSSIFPPDPILERWKIPVPIAATLASMNDGSEALGDKAFTFPEIADWIDKSL